MADQLRTTFSEIADAIRTKSGTTEPISARNFASSILNLNAGGSKITVYTLIPPCTAVPIDSTTMIENIYFNTSLSEAEVISIIDNAFASVPDLVELMEERHTYVFANASFDKMVMIAVNEGTYIVQAFNGAPEGPADALVFITGPGASEYDVSFTGWNPNFDGAIAINETNAFCEMQFSNMNILNDAKQLNEALKELISSTPF